eukprot:GGOE01001896.1.p1 GENE.GGOE01001896.1~~GGOE01001896.1.p1  ORF type:complete len:577 (-),score=150.56 GGOE01001896.1:174-1904(-)
MADSLRGLPEKVCEEVEEQIKKLELLQKAGILSSEDLEVKKEKLIFEAKAKVETEATWAAKLDGVEHLSPNVKETTSEAFRIQAHALLNEYFQHIKEAKPEVTCHVLPHHPQSYVVCRVRCKVNGNEMNEAMIGPNKKLVHAEIAMKFLRILLPEFQDPDDMFCSIRGLSRHRNTPASDKKRFIKVVPEYQPGLGRIVSPLGNFGPSLPVVTGDSDDPSRILQRYCEFHKVDMPNLVMERQEGKKTLKGTMEVTIDGTKHDIAVECEDLLAARQETCMQLLKKFFPDYRDKKAIAAAVEKLHNDEQERKRQKTAAENLSLASHAMTILSLYCQATRQPMPDIDKQGRLSIRKPDGVLVCVDTNKVKKKLARPEGCLRLLKLLYKDMDIEEMRAAVNELMVASKKETKIQNRLQARVERLQNPQRGPYSGRPFRPYPLRQARPGQYPAGLPCPPSAVPTAKPAAPSSDAASPPPPPTAVAAAPSLAPAGATPLVAKPPAKPPAASLLPKPPAAYPMPHAMGSMPTPMFPPPWAMPGKGKGKGKGFHPPPWAFGGSPPPYGAPWPGAYGAGAMPYCGY